MALGDELRYLARRHPRGTWADHANLGALARFWLQRHDGFRRLEGVIRSGAEGALDQPIEPVPFKSWLADHLRWFLGELETHHQIEDHHYFPVFRRAEPRLAAGFELLERDHEGMHTAIAGLVGHARIVLATPNADGIFRTELARFHSAHVALGRELHRHLDDEEDLIIPLILERGEHALVG